MTSSTEPRVPTTTASSVRRGTFGSASRGLEGAARLADVGSTPLDELGPGGPLHDPDPLHAGAVELEMHGRTRRVEVRSDLAFRDDAGLGADAAPLLPFGRLRSKDEVEGSESGDGRAAGGMPPAVVDAPAVAARRALRALAA